uniref:Fungal lipase-like domain-containing protein n=1 Tax=Entomoneis paludosa TaxID=265537 RepID=A0A7S2YHJ8_9STRA|mmetsp:Transcript_33390/g.69533  ORF Transcript_33390/g.69533 Transcript_33390/m.69533 type:complete len:1065 (+) Transcript_33390:135-3329(+)
MMDSSREETQPPPATAEEGMEQVLDTPSNNHNNSNKITFQDHYTLPTPSNAVRFRGSTLCVAELRNSQLQLEQHQNTKRKHSTTTVVIKKVANDKATHLNLLRLTYGTVGFFYVGFLFVVCFQVLLFLFMDLVVDSGLTENAARPGKFLGTLLSLPVFLYGLSSAMALGSAFLSDVWSGHALLRQVGQSSNMPEQKALQVLIAMEWIAFGTLLGIPLLTWIITLWARLDDWWRITLLTWFASVTVYYVGYSFGIMYYEVQASWLMLQVLSTTDTVAASSSWWTFVTRAIAYRQAYQYSGQSDLVRLSTDLEDSHHPGVSIKSDEGDNPQKNINEEEEEEAQEKEAEENAPETPQQYGHPNWWGYLTLWGIQCCGKCGKKGHSLFQKVSPPERVPSLYELLGTRQFVTRHNWSLEKLFCSTHQRLQAVTVVQGPAALHPAQMVSSLICTAVGIGLVILLCVAGLVWMESSVGTAILLAVLIAFGCCLGRWQSSRRLYQLYQHVQQEHDTTAASGMVEKDDDNDDEAVDGQEPDNNGNNVKAEEDQDIDEQDYEEEEEQAAIYQSFEKYRVTKPSATLGWCLFGLEMGLFFIWPTIALFAINNYPVAVFFVALGIISMIRYYLNPSILLKEIGSLDAVYAHGLLGQKQAGDNNEDPAVMKRTKKSRAQWSRNQQRQWNAQSRLFAILTHVTRGPSRTTWLYVFFLLALAVIFMSVGALTESAEDSVSSADEIVLLPRGEFVYEPTPNLPYPTCALAKGVQVPNSNATALADYAFLSVMAYQPPETFQEKLDLWFGPGVATDEVEIVRDFRQQVEGGNAAVSYHWVTFLDSTAGVVVVRGSTTSWEWLTDAQLWSAAGIAQIIRALLPLGELFTPIIPQLLKGVSFIESSNLDDVALYKQTTAFVQSLQASGNYSQIQITGQSLGGGISLITGAQTGIPAIAISGPNNMLSRKTFDPIFSKDDITQYLFNVIPERDVVPRVDDWGMQHQEIRCRAKANDLFGCHSSIRSLCEIMYTCGSHARPPLCECATKFGYPEAIPVGSGNESSYTAICGTCRTNDGYYSDCEG